jgi:hypothetical protein
MTWLHRHALASAVGAVVIVSAVAAVVIVRGGITVALASPQHGGSSEIRLAPHWGLFSDASWNTVATRFERRGFVRGSVRIVTGTSLMRNRESFVLLSARSKSGRTCFVVVRGTSMGATICQISKPLLIFSARDLCVACSPKGQPPLKALTMLVLTRRDVSSVQEINGGHRYFVGLVGAGDGSSAFNASGMRYGTILRARSKTNSILAALRLARNA